MIQKKEKVALGLAIVILVSIFVYYRYAKDVLVMPKENMVATDQGTMGTRELSSVVTYDAYEGKMDTLRFVVVVDAEGAIVEIKTLEASTGEVPEKKKEFNSEVNVLLKGKKLSELKAIDKVGESSRTTEAFNKALPDIQAAL